MEMVIAEFLCHRLADWSFHGFNLKFVGDAGAAELLLTVTATGEDVVEFPELSVATAVRV